MLPVEITASARNLLFTILFSTGLLTGALDEDTGATVSMKGAAAMAVLAGSGGFAAKAVPARTKSTNICERTFSIGLLPLRNLAPQDDDFVYRIMVEDYCPDESHTIPRKCGEAEGRNGTW